MEVEIGTRVVLYATLANASSIVADATSVNLITRTPDGAVATLPLGGGVVQRTAVGALEGYVDITQAGDWQYRWVATGGVIAAGRGIITARESYF